eukprot:TRINITY_DN7646_c0_g1_i1.p2 TRINITY_DN7646_c0_g1~~TRINITY_DN7646_c0_g1_i1.p2  ORF type:complete len:174 (-),score=4.19 TRINITY_DN7646_c0_g1_i1:28-471(-)
MHLRLNKEYSYSKRGVPAYRTNQNVPHQLNMIMAMTNKNVFAYQIRNGTFNEIAFIAFIISLTQKIFDMGIDYAKTVVLFMDNVSFHRSELVMNLFNILPFKVLYNGIYWHNAHAIEFAFGIIKGKLKKTYSRVMYIQFSLNNIALV